MTAFVRSTGSMVISTPVIVEDFECPLSARETLAILSTDEKTRQRVMARAREFGVSLDRWTRLDVQGMARAVSDTEDKLEHETTRVTPARAMLRSLRRRLEVP